MFDVVSTHFFYSNDAILYLQEGKSRRGLSEIYSRPINHSLPGDGLSVVDSMAFVLDSNKYDLVYWAVDMSITNQREYNNLSPLGLVYTVVVNIRFLSSILIYGKIQFLGRLFFIFKRLFCSGWLLLLASQLKNL